ncbi:trans-sialidase, putative, partial [Trypanosoma cruzi marinkellei]
MCCGIGGAAQAVRPNSSQESSPKPYFGWRDVKSGETVSSLHVPGLVEVNGNVFAVSEAQCTEASHSGFTGIASELLELSDKKPNEELDLSKLRTQVLEECLSNEKSCASQNGTEAGSQSRKKVPVRRPTTVVNGNDIYMLAGNYSFEANGSTAATAQWGLLVAVGNVSEGNGKKIRIGTTLPLSRGL